MFVILLSVLNAFLCAVALITWQLFSASGFDFALVLILFFGFFVISFFVMYFIYNPFIFGKIKNVHNDLLKILPQNEIPDTKFQLDEIDPITQLDLEVKKLRLHVKKN